MPSIKPALFALATGAAFLMSAAAALAEPGYATSNVNVRSGPGSQYGVVDTMRRGEEVDIGRCRGSWCFVERRGPDGWVSANYLESAGWNDDYYRPRPPRPPVYYDPRPPRPPYWGNPRPPVWNNPRPRPNPQQPVWNPPPPGVPAGGRTDGPPCEIMPGTNYCKSD